MESRNQTEISFSYRFSTAVSCFFRCLGDADFAWRIAGLLRPSTAPERSPPPAAAKPVEAKPVQLPPERLHASGLVALSLLQREGRLVDFLQEDVAAFSDAEVGAAARVVHAGCKKAFKEYFTVEPVLREAEGASVQVPPGFDAQRIRITGNVTGQPPYRGTLKHHGWVVTAVRMPTLSETLDPRVLAAAEVEL